MMYQLRIAISLSGEVRREYERYHEDRGWVRISRQAYRKAEASGKPCRVVVVVAEGLPVVQVGVSRVGGV